MSRHTFRPVSALIALSSCFVIISFPACYPHAKDNVTKKEIIKEKEVVSPPAAVTYYADAEGSFTLKPPASVTGSALRLSGNSSFPELSITIRNTGSGASTRQLAYRTGGREEFNFSYLIKDGAGDYSVIIYGRRSLSDLRLVGLCEFTVRSIVSGQDEKTLPDINGQILSFVNTAMGKTVGRGECWDLAQEALDAAGADWSRPFTFGTLLDPDRDRIRPGDIIQFRSLKIVERNPDGGTKWQIFGAPDHTAVIVSVDGVRKYRLAHQNIEGKRSVLVSPVDLKLMTAGRFWIYRPVAGIIK